MLLGVGEGVHSRYMGSHGMFVSDVGVHWRYMRCCGMFVSSVGCTEGTWEAVGCLLVV